MVRSGWCFYLPLVVSGVGGSVFRPPQSPESIPGGDPTHFTWIMSFRSALELLWDLAGTNSVAVDIPEEAPCRTS